MKIYIIKNHIINTLQSKTDSLYFIHFFTLVKLTNLNKYITTEKQKKTFIWNQSLPYNSSDKNVSRDKCNLKNNQSMIGIIVHVWTVKQNLTSTILPGIIKDLSTLWMTKFFKCVSVCQKRLGLGGWKKLYIFCYLLGRDF